ncbi:MAG TPA: hypothetical protein VNW52_12335, partial [Burkholderiaceae bacterium]|nr:hypothetical protein [Burkholderiaceae bacterium]
GRFRYLVDIVGTDSLLTLPGDAESWPQDVEADGKRIAVTGKEENPSIHLSPGAHVITGNFDWRELPQNLIVPKATGILQLKLSGATIPGAKPDEEGRLMLRRQESSGEAEESLNLRRYRLIEDSVPLQATAHFDLGFSGKGREITIPNALLPGYIPLEINSPLPARLDANGSLHIQALPGQWVITLSGRMMTPATQLELPKAESTIEEVWSFKPRNDLRVVTIDGVPTVDAKQVPMPAEWQAYPAYLMNSGSSLHLKEVRRGDSDPKPDQLTLARQLWLDFDGGGYTVSDHITGRLSRSQRLEMMPAQSLGRVANEGVDQLVTRLQPQGPAGVEIRSGSNIDADSRINSDNRNLSATGWLHDFNGLSMTLHLPPGWQLAHASGTDQVNGAWSSQWTLFDFFFVLLATLATGKLFGWKIGGLALVALIITWHSDDAPTLLWVALLAVTAIWRALGAGKLKRLADWLRWIVLCALGFMLLAFSVNQVRYALYPSLELSSSHYNMAPAPAPIETKEIEEVKPSPPPPAMPDVPPPEAMIQSRQVGVVSSMMLSKASPDKLNRIDPGAKVQTGPGLPTWQWRQASLSWQGPVQQSQQVHLWLISPGGNVLLNIARVLLSFVLFWRLSGLTIPRLRKTITAAPVMILPLVMILTFSAVPQNAQAQANDSSPPDSAILNELREKITTAPDCLPNCAELARLLVSAAGDNVALRLEVHTQANVLIPLPGQPSEWLPQEVEIDGKRASLRRDDNGMLWLMTPIGVHQITMLSKVDKATSLQISLPLRPRAVQSKLDGWLMSGLDERGLAGDALQIARVSKKETKSSDTLERDSLPPFVRIERHISLDQVWGINTRISRVGPSQAPIMVRIALLDGEAVTSSSIKVDGNFAIVNLGAAAETEFTSTLKPAAGMTLVASGEANQIETWGLEVSPMWHVNFSGLAATHPEENALRFSEWHPWQGESVKIAVTKPAGVEGQTLTIDLAKMTVQPGARATDVALLLTMRSSQGGQHAITLPEGSELQGVTINGQNQSISLEGRTLRLPLMPGAQSVEIHWRQAEGIDSFFKTPIVDLGSPGVNSQLEIKVPDSRWVLLVGGPRLGPAVLFWGSALVMLVVAVALSRSKLAPLGLSAWFLLGMGLTQSSMLASVVVAAWFFAIVGRQRYTSNLNKRADYAVKGLLGVWTIAVIAIIFSALQHGLLGFPDMQISGNNSSADSLDWYKDRWASQLPTAWAVSIPVLAYRLLMLLWALWLAKSILTWAKWAWSTFTEKKPPEPLAVE